MTCLGYRRSSTNVSFLSFSEIQHASQHSCLMTPHPLPEEVGKKSTMIRVLQRGKLRQRIRKFSVPKPCTWGRCFYYSCHPLIQSTSAVEAMSPILQKHWVLYGVDTAGMGNRFRTSRPNNGRDQSPPARQELSHWFLFLPLFFWRTIHLTARFLASGLSPGLVHSWPMDSNSANHLSNLSKTSVKGGKLTVGSHRKPHPGLVTIEPHELCAQKDCPAPTG